MKKKIHFQKKNTKKENYFRIRRGTNHLCCTELFETYILGNKILKEYLFSTEENNKVAVLSQKEINYKRTTPF